MNLEVDFVWIYGCGVEVESVAAWHRGICVPSADGYLPMDQVDAGSNPVVALFFTQSR